MNEYSRHRATVATIEDHADVVTNRTFDELSIGETASLVRIVSGNDIKLLAAVSGDVNPALLGADSAALDHCRCSDDDPILKLH